MRNFIISLSVLFYILAGIITYKASVLPVRNTRHQNKPDLLESKNLSSEIEDILGEFAKDQAFNNALVEELQATIAGLEGKLLNKKGDTQAVEELQARIAGLDDRLSNRNEMTQANVEKLQATIARLEDKLSYKKEDTQTDIETKGNDKNTGFLSVLGGDGAFSPGQISINENLVNVIEGLVPDILTVHDYYVTIEGHTDNIPIRLSTLRRYRDNMELSFLRAKAVALILVKNGISFERISVIGYGDTRPIVSNDTDEGRAKNRRVEIKLNP